MAADTAVCEVHGDARALLTAERPALNFLQLLSGTATIDAAATCARSRAPRRIPGAAPSSTRARRSRACARRRSTRSASAAAANQRLALWDGILIKENHIAAAGGVAAALARRASRSSAGVEIQIEVETPGPAARGAGGRRHQRAARQLHARAHARGGGLTAGRALLEVSGGVTLDRLREIAATGVDRISIGALTKDVRAVDYSMRVVRT